MSALDERFAATASVDNDLDWDEVVARSGVSFRESRPWVALAAFAAIAAIAAGAVLGVRLHGATAAVPGPTHVQRRVPNGTIHWLFAHEPRGKSLAAAHISVLSTVGAHWQPVRFARVLEPAPGVKMAVTLIGKRGRNICMTVYLPDGGEGGCAVGLLLRPYNAMTSWNATSGSSLAGLAGDDVARLELFLPGGGRRAVRLVDNAFFVRIAADEYPSNLVAYDSTGRVIGSMASRKPHFLKP